MVKSTLMVLFFFGLLRAGLLFFFLVSMVIVILFFFLHNTYACARLPLRINFTLSRVFLSAQTLI